MPTPPNGSVALRCGMKLPPPGRGGGMRRIIVQREQLQAMTGTANSL
ncbi:MAG: hypothetical protein F6J98_04590 [Moorea sp. SIO4G2]|nr:MULTISPECIES: hypothetical protein [unclassified Moorena]NEO17037.1 hypothetical protein [Moorena sp. SIO3E8]NEO59721.1 hypothetical protein [Moorena sp. SIO4G2]NEP23709.1 hypothetical protein [Moorena sp. SIO3I6]NEQ03613.1 hypothetical protein [Moorena sp. SIO3F7]